jgi:pteridine reductase
VTTSKKTALITGGARRLGKAFCEALAARGIDLVIHYNKSEQEAFELKKILEQRYKILVTLFKADLTDVEELIFKAQELINIININILINNASSYYATAFGDISLKEWDELVKSNLTGPFFLTQVIAEKMLKHKEGKIINIADWSALRPDPHHAPYSIAKAGIVAMTQILAQNLAPHIQVNCISPGTVLLPDKSSKEREENIIKSTPLLRIGAPEDIVNALLFFLEGTNFATGSNLILDGGRFVKS